MTIYETTLSLHVTIGTSFLNIQTDIAELALPKCFHPATMIRKNHKDISEH
jgi:hypothetical protein